jgi:alpha-tubulin suppressor-like RCC1 family protein
MWRQILTKSVARVRGSLTPALRRQKRTYGYGTGGYVNQQGGPDNAYFRSPFQTLFFIIDSYFLRSNISYVTCSLMLSYMLEHTLDRINDYVWFKNNDGRFFHQMLERFPEEADDDDDDDEDDDDDDE